MKEKLKQKLKQKKGFTIVELLAVIVVLGVILVIATTNVMQSINDSKKKAKYIFIISRVKMTQIKST